MPEAIAITRREYRHAGRNRRDEWRRRRRLRTMVRNDQRVGAQRLPILAQQPRFAYGLDIAGQQCAAKG